MVVKYINQLSYYILYIAVIKKPLSEYKYIPIFLSNVKQIKKNIHKMLIKE